MRLTSTLAEAFHTMLAQRVASVLVALLCGATCVVTLLTVGSTAAAEAQVAARLDAAGSRLIIVTDTKHAGLVTPAVIDVLGGLNTVERAVGVASPFDVTNSVIGDGATAAPAWVLVHLDQAVRLTWGRWPRPGEALVSDRAQRALGLAAPAGAVTDRGGREHPVVGAFAARVPFEFLDAGVVVSHDPDGPAVDSLYLVAVSAASAGVSEHAAIMAMAPASMDAVRVESPATLAELQGKVGGDLGRFSHSLLLLTVGSGGFLITVVVLAEVLLRRRDLGRRRALGAPRWGLVALVVARTTIAAAPGAAAGLAAGTVAARVWVSVPPPEFIAGTGVITLLTAAVAAVPAAVMAAWRDPISVLRTP